MQNGLYSINRIRFVINQKNKMDYIKNGGGYMAYLKKGNQNINSLFEDLKKFLEEEEKREKQEKFEKDLTEEKALENEIDDVSDKTKETNSQFSKTFLEQQFMKALFDFDIKTAKSLKEKIDFLDSNKEQVCDDEDETKNAKLVLNCLQEFLDKNEEIKIRFEKFLEEKRKNV